MNSNIGYLDLINELSPLEINENSVMSHLIRYAQKEKLPKDISKTILEILEIKKSQNAVIPIKPEDNIDEYMKKVATIRMHQGKMPRECCQFIIKQAILKNIEVLNYKGMMERALEDFTEYELEDLNIDDYCVEVIEQHFFNGKDTGGDCNDRDKIIRISEENLKINGMFKALETALHECTHAKQLGQIEKREMNGHTYKILKENIIEMHDEGYYDKNYGSIYKEIHARENSYLKRIKVLKSLGLTKEQIKDLGIDNVKNYTLENFRKAYAIDGKLKRYNEKSKFMDGIFFELLQQQPEILEQYPELGRKFEKSGETIKKKSYFTILKECKKSINSAQTKEEKGRLSSLYREILLNETPIPEDEQQQEFKKLMVFESDNPIINALKNKVLQEKFSPEGTVKE